MVNPNMRATVLYNVEFELGASVVIYPTDDEATTHGLNVGGGYAGMVVGQTNDEYGAILFIIRVFLADGTDITVTRSEMSYRSKGVPYSFTDTVPKGTFHLVFEKHHCIDLPFINSGI